MSLQILFHLKFAPLPFPSIPTWQLSRAWMWPWDGDGIVSHWGGTLAPAFDQWSLDWCWHSAFTGKWLESATPAVPWTVLLKIDSSWAGGTELGQQDPLDLHHALRPPCGLAWQMSILSRTTPTGLLEAVSWEGTSFPQLLLSSSDDTVHACQWVTQLVTHSLRTYI